MEEDTMLVMLKLMAAALGVPLTLVGSVWLAWRVSGWHPPV